MTKAWLEFASISKVGVIALALLLTFWVSGWSLARAQQGAMLNCPPPGRWAISVWMGYLPAEPEHAFTTACGSGAVEAAYYLDPITQTWQRWFSGRPELSNLGELDHEQGVIALGSTTAPEPPPEPTATFLPPESRSPEEAEGLRGLLPVLNEPFYIDYPGLSGPDSFTAVLLEPGAVEAAIQWLEGNGFDLQLLTIDYVEGSPPEVGGIDECPLPSRWAMAVWRGYDRTDPGEAFANACGVGAVDAAYRIDRNTQTWQRWFALRPDLSNLDALDDGQGVIALGSANPPQPTPVPTVIPPQPLSLEEAERLRGLGPVLNDQFNIVWSGFAGSDSFTVVLWDPGAVEAAVKWLKDNGFDLRLMSIGYMEVSSYMFMDHFSLP